MEYWVKFISPFQSHFPETHRGYDITFDCPPDIPIRAMADGIIVRTGWDDPKNPEEGDKLRIRQLVSLPGFDSWMLVYGHLGQLKSYIGKGVKAGETIALSKGPVTVHLIDRTRTRRQIPFESD